MERISALIEKLRDQFASGTDIDQLLLTTQLLEGELRYHRQKGTVPASPHVAVLMPNNGHRPSPKLDPNPEHERFLPPVEPVPPKELSPVKDITPPAEVAPTKESPAPWEAAPVRETPPAREAVPARETPAWEAAPVMQAAGLNGNGYRTGDTRSAPEAYNPINEVPTLTHQLNKESRKELNESMAGQNSKSLNDSLKGPQRELSAALTEAPIRDLRKAIGINDRYVFISELFRGDEIMYERSIKTINNFSIFQEAYYWMERELKLKLAWDQERTSTQLFYQLVRRRFS